MGIPYSPPIPTNGDTIPAREHASKAKYCGGTLQPFYRILLFHIEKEAEPNRDTVHVVKNRMAVTGISNIRKHSY